MQLIDAGESDYDDDEIAEPDLLRKSTSIEMNEEKKESTLLSNGERGTESMAVDLTYPSTRPMETDRLDPAIMKMGTHRYQVQVADIDIEVIKQYCQS